MLQQINVLLRAMPSALVLIAAVAASHSVQALPSSFSLSLEAYSDAPGGGSQNFYGITASGPLSKSGSYSDGALGASQQYARRGPSSMTTVVSADTGTLGASFMGSSMSVSDPVAGVVPGAQAFGRALIEARWNDFIVTGPVAPTVSVSFNALFDHNYQFTQQSDLGISKPGVSLFITGVGGSAILYQKSLSQNTAITSDVFNAPVGVPFDIKVTFSTAARAVAGPNSAVTFQAQAGLVNTIDFQTSFSFGATPITVLSSPLDFIAADALPAGSGPVFNLPAGYTLNSVQANIVNNHWLGGSLAPVPEPGTLVLMLLGLVGILSRRCSRRVAHPEARMNGLPRT